MNTEDHAILVGIANYPALGEGDTPLNLKGPENDVDAVFAWMTDPKGGDMPKGNIQIVTSDFSAPTAAANPLPTITELESAVEKLDRMAQANREAGKGLKVGRRLYIYMSGHGFSPSRQRGCLYAANARERAGHNVHASGWVALLQDAGYFREFVLWMDCCMNRIFFLPPRDPPLPPVNAPEPPGATFIAYAAQRPLKAVEVSIPEDANKHHGVFTWALLEGLKGAAADGNGRVTGHSLANWIRNAQAARLSPGDRDDVDVAKEPEVVAEDPMLIFARGLPPPAYPVRLSFPNEAIGKEARLWSGAPPRVEQELVVGPGVHELSLMPGLYAIDVPATKLRQGFEVVAPTAIQIEEHGDPVVVPDAQQMLDLHVDPGDATAEIFVIDRRFSLVDGMPGRLTTPLPFGIYKIKTRLGRGIRERVIVLDRDRPPLVPEEIVHPLATAAPVDRTTATHEYQVGAAHAALAGSFELWRTNNKPTITVMARVWSGKNGAMREAQPWKGVTVVDARGKVVLDLARSDIRDTTGDPFAVQTISVTPGVYFLRLRLDGATVVEQSLVAGVGWGLEVQILRRPSRDGDRLDPRPRISVRMRDLKHSDPWDEGDRLIETARIALADERRVLSEELIQRLLWKKYGDPIMGIIGAHLLLLEHERNPALDLTILNTVVRNLRELLPGTDHPDVEALSLRCLDKTLRSTKPLIVPPMFQRSWKLLVEACSEHPALIPRRLYRRVIAQTALPPYFVWAVNEEIKAKSLTELARAAWAPESSRAEAMPAAPQDLAQGFAGGVGPQATEPAAERRSIRSTRIDAKMARERAIRLQVPTSAFDLLKKEYQTGAGLGRTTDLGG